MSDLEHLPREPAREPAREPSRRSGLARLLWPLVAAGGVLLKLAGSIKFFGIFIAVGGYALIWGWTFAVGFVLLIAVHEMGHLSRPSDRASTRRCRCSCRSSAPTWRCKNSRSTRGGTRSSRSQARSRAGSARWRARLRGGAGLALPARARLHRLLSQPHQPGPDRLPRRRSCAAGVARARAAAGAPSPAEARRLGRVVAAYSAATALRSSSG